MRKPGSNSHWNRLAAPQRETVEKWLFEEHLSYDDVLARVKGDFGLETSRASLCHYYQRRAREREMEDLVEAQALSEAVASSRQPCDHSASGPRRHARRIVIARRALFRLLRPHSE